MEQSIAHQALIRRNAEEHHDFLKGLDDWEAGIKRRDEELRGSKGSVVSAARESGEDAKSLIPAPSCGKGSSVQSGGDFNSSLKASGKHSFVIQQQTEKKTPRSLPANIGSTDPIPQKTRDDLEEDERVRGNYFYADGNYAESIKSYTRCLCINPKSTTAFSNRGESTAAVNF